MRERARRSESRRCTISASKALKGVGFIDGYIVQHATSKASSYLVLMLVHAIDRLIQLRQFVLSHPI